MRLVKDAIKSFYYIQKCRKKAIYLLCIRLSQESTMNSEYDNFSKICELNPQTRDKLISSFILDKIQSYNYNVLNFKKFTQNKIKSDPKNKRKSILSCTKKKKIIPKEIFFCLYTQPVVLKSSLTRLMGGKDSRMKKTIRFKFT
jgi:hypothetical protein